MCTASCCFSLRPEDQARGERLALARASRLAALKARGGAADTFDASRSEEFNTVTGDDKFWAAQVRYPAWDFQPRSGPLPLACESAESQFVRADDSAPPKPNRVRESAPASATVGDSTHPQKVEDGTCRTDYNGYKICRALSCSQQRPVPASAVATSASAVYSPASWRLAMCSRSAKPIVLKKTKAAGRDTVAAVRKCHTLPPRQLVTPCGCPLGYASLFDAVLRYNGAVSQPTEGIADAFCRSAPGNAIAARLASVGIRDVIIGDGDADNPLGLAVDRSTRAGRTIWARVSSRCYRREGTATRLLRLKTRSSIDSSKSPSPLRMSGAFTRWCMR